MRQSHEVPGLPALKASTPRFIRSISLALQDHQSHQDIPQESLEVLSDSSAVLFLLGLRQSEQGRPPEPCLILNKRSESVRQAGDLCCPGGGISLPLDSHIARLLTLPGSPLKRGPLQKWWRDQPTGKRRSLALLLATSLRESYEEMRLNPLRVAFLGPLPVQKLGLFGRRIYPMVGWVSGQRRFTPNWEVDSIVPLPFRHLLEADNYCRIRFEMAEPNETGQHLYERDHPCITHAPERGSDALWGATYRILMTFLKIVFRFEPPSLDSLPLVRGTLSRNYFEGGRRHA